MNSRNQKKYPKKIFAQLFTVLSAVTMFSVLLPACQKERTIDPGSPLINGISPEKGYPGTTVTIKGLGFSDAPEANTVTFDGVPAIVIDASQTELTAEAPSHAAGKVSVIVKVNGKSSNAVQFEYLAVQNSSYFPAADKIYNYELAGPDETFSFYKKLLEQKDSAGLQVIKLGSFLPGTSITEYAYRSSSETVYQMTAPQQALDVLESLKQSPGYISGVLEGFPLNEHMSNDPLINQPVVYTGGPVHMRVTLKSETPSLPYIFVDFKQYYLDGKILGFETVTTAAGVFENCLKWEYNTKTVTESSAEGLTEKHYHNTVWYAKEIGLVKDVEEGPESTTTTVLTGIAAQ